MKNNTETNKHTNQTEAIIERYERIAPDVAVLLPNPLSKETASLVGELIETARFDLNDTRISRLVPFTEIETVAIVIRLSDRMKAEYLRNLPETKELPRSSSYLTFTATTENAAKLLRYLKVPKEKMPQLKETDELFLEITIAKGGENDVQK